MKKTSGFDFRSELSKARGLGAAKHGVSHWWLQRLTAVALIPFTIWFMVSIISVMTAPDVITVAGWFSSPLNALCMVVLLSALFFHAKLGLQVVIEDYVKCPCAKYSLLLGNSFFCFGGAAICIMAVLKLHFLNIAVSGAL